MPRDTDVLCLHCQKYMPRSRERAHRAKLHIPKYSPPPPLPSRLKRIFDIDIELEPEQATISAEEGQDITKAVPHDSRSEAQDEPAVRAARHSILERWRPDRYHRDVDSDVGPELEDWDGEDLVGSASNELDETLNWDEIGIGGLSAWDQLGEYYEKDAANTGESLSEA